MVYDLQKASFWKRIAAWIFDSILLCVLAVGVGVILSWTLKYDSYNNSIENAYAKYEAQYDITFDISQETYEAMTEEERGQYDAAYDALISDKDAMHAYNMVLNLTLIILSAAILLAILILEFVVPLFLKNGQTFGKRMFSIGLVRPDCVKITGLQLFVRTLLGKYAVETMIPVYVLLMLFWGSIDLMGTVLLAALLLAQIIVVAVNRNRSALHDLMAATVVVDISSQMVFDTQQDLIEYKQKIHAEMAARQNY